MTPTTNRKRLGAFAFGALAVAPLAPGAAEARLPTPDGEGTAPATSRPDLPRTADGAEHVIQQRQQRDADVNPSDRGLTVRAPAPPPREVEAPRPTRAPSTPPRSSRPAQPAPARSTPPRAEPSQPSHADLPRTADGAEHVIQQRRETQRQAPRPVASRPVAPRRTERPQPERPEPAAAPRDQPAPTPAAPSGVPRTPDAAERWLRERNERATRATPPPARTQAPTPTPTPTPTAAPAPVPVTTTPPVTPSTAPRASAPSRKPAKARTSYGDEHRTPTPVRQPRPQPANPTIHVPESEPANTPPAPEPVSAAPDPEPAKEHKSGTFSIGIDVNLPGKRFDVHHTTGPIDPWIGLDPGGRVSPEVREAVTDRAVDTANRVADAPKAAREWLDKKPTCVGGTFYRTGGGGGELCMDTATGKTAWSGQVGVGSGASAKAHRPDELPTERYCGVGATVSSPTLFGRYERRYNIDTGRWYNDYDWGVSVPYKTNRYLPLDGASTGPSKGRHVASGGQRGPASGSAPRHRAPFSPVKAGSNLVKPGSAAGYATCGGPGPKLW